MVKDHLKTNKCSLSCSKSCQPAPQVVFNQSGDREASLSKAACEMEAAFGKLMQQIYTVATLRSPRWTQLPVKFTLSACHTFDNLRRQKLYLVKLLVPPVSKSGRQSCTQVFVNHISMLHNLTHLLADSSMGRALAIDTIKNHAVKAQPLAMQGGQQCIPRHGSQSAQLQREGSAHDSTAACLRLCLAAVPGAVCGLEAGRCCIP